jgi:hypothetical protein
MSDIFGSKIPADPTMLSSLLGSTSYWRAGRPGAGRRVPDQYRHLDALIMR